MSRQTEVPVYTLGLDVGNFTIKSAVVGQSGSELVIRSLYADIHYGVTPKRFSETSPLVVVEGLQGRVAYHFGEKAYAYPTGYTALVLGDKNEIDVFRRAMLASLRPIEGATHYKLNLVISVPSDYKRSQTEALQGLVGNYRFTRNGIDYCVEVLSVRHFLEGVPAFAYASSISLIPERGYTVMIDIGGGTWNGLVLDNDGEIVGEPLSREKGGGIGLATAIAQNSRLRVPLGDEPELAVIMDGFANRSFEYGETGISWKDWSKDYIDGWYQAGMQFIGASIKPYLKSVTAYVFSGGNAHLIEDRVKAAQQKALEAGSRVQFILLPDPELANVRGLTLL